MLRHWRRAVGRLVQVDVAGAPLTGRVRRSDDDGVELDVAGSARRVEWSELGRGRVQIEFNRLEEE